jgi:hypothetical protein
MSEPGRDARYHSAKLPATWLASFFINVLTAIIVLSRGNIALTGQTPVDIFILLSLVLNILFFFYVEAFTESDPGEQARLQGVWIIEWYLRVANQFLLSLLWLLLEFGLGYFLAGYFTFYVILLFWDFVVCQPVLLSNGRIDVPKVVKYDLWGFCTTILFVFAVALEKIYQGGMFFAFDGKGQVVPSHIMSLVKDLPKEAVHSFSMLATGGCVVAYVIILVFTKRSMDFKLLRILVTRERLS